MMKKSGIWNVPFLSSVRLYLFITATKRIASSKTVNRLKEVVKLLVKRGYTTGTLKYYQKLIIIPFLKLNIINNSR
jgi:hypothetical protein